MAEGGGAVGGVHQEARLDGPRERGRPDRVLDDTGGHQRAGDGADPHGQQRRRVEGREASVHRGGERVGQPGRVVGRVGSGTGRGELGPQLGVVEDRPQHPGAAGAGAVVGRDQPGGALELLAQRVADQVGHAGALEAAQLDERAVAGLGDLGHVVVGADQQGRARALALAHDLGALRRVAQVGVVEHDQHLVAAGEHRLEVVDELERRAGPGPGSQPTHAHALGGRAPRGLVEHGAHPDSRAAAHDGGAHLAHHDLEDRQLTVATSHDERCRPGGAGGGGHRMIPPVDVRRARRPAPPEQVATG